MMSYGRFAAMILVSTLVMYGLMYLNTYEAGHVFFSQTRAWMALLMGATMAFIMLAFMRGMYQDRQRNMLIFAGSIAVFAGSLFMVRSQASVGDVSYMEAMIPHHSIAVMTSSRAHIKDPRVRELADGILKAQVEEIAQMEGLIAALKENPPPADAPDIEAPPVSSFEPPAAR